MKRPLALFPVALLLFACGGEPSVASKSAAAYREAQAKGLEIGGGHQHGGPEAPATTSSVADPHAGHMSGPGAIAPAAADAHAGHTSGARAIAPATADPHAGHMSGSGATAPAAADVHAGHTSGARAIAPATADPHAGHMSGARATPSATTDAHAGHTGGARAIAPAMADAHAGHTGGVRASLDASPAIDAPSTSAEMRQLRPATTLQSDPFDAAVPVSVSEAARASGAEASHEGHKP